MSVAAARARMAAQRELLVKLDLAGHDVREGERLLAALGQMLVLEKAERRMWSRLAARAKQKPLSTQSS